jgi:hypothetical protein
MAELKTVIIIRRIGNKVSAAIPVIGLTIVFFLFGGITLMSAFGVVTGHGSDIVTVELLLETLPPFGALGVIIGWILCYLFFGDKYEGSHD